MISSYLLKEYSYSSESFLKLVKHSFPLLLDLIQHQTFSLGGPYGKCRGKGEEGKQEVLFVAICSHMVMLFLPAPFPLTPSDQFGGKEREGGLCFLCECTRWLLTTLVLATDAWMSAFL